MVELYSRPSVVPVAAARGMRATLSVDILSGTDLLKSERRHQIIHELKSRRSRFLITSAPCTEYSKLQEMWNHPHMGPITKQLRLADADALFDFDALC